MLMPLFYAHNHAVVVGTYAALNNGFTTEWIETKAKKLWKLIGFSVGGMVVMCAALLYAEYRKWL